MKINGCVELSHKYAEKGLAIPLFVIEEIRADDRAKVQNELLAYCRNYVIDCDLCPFGKCGTCYIANGLKEQSAV